MRIRIITGNTGECVLHLHLSICPSPHGIACCHSQSWKELGIVRRCLLGIPPCNPAGEYHSAPVRQDSRDLLAHVGFAAAGCGGLDPCLAHA